MTDDQPDLKVTTLYPLDPGCQSLGIKFLFLVIPMCGNAIWQY